MKQLLILITMVPLMLKGQFEKPTDEVQYQHICKFDAEIVSKHIIQKHIKSYLEDTVEFSVEKRGNKYSKKYLSSSKVEKKILNLFKKGNVEYSSRTNAGYTFTIAVIDRDNETDVLNYIKFEVDHYSQKIHTIEILRGM